MTEISEISHNTEIEIILITSYYHSSNEGRQLEIDDCLRRNAKNPLIKSIHLLNDQIYDLSFIDSISEKITQVVVDDDNKKRLSFLYAISYANRNFPGKICMLANSDIYYDETLSKLNTIPTEIWPNTFLAISRYNDGKLQPSCAGSQDTWIFQSPTSFDPEKDCNFNFGIPACDHRIAHIFHQNGYQVINPCHDIITHHLHSSNFRNYSGAVNGGHVYIDPSGLTPQKNMARVVNDNKIGDKGIYVSHLYFDMNGQCAPRKNRKTNFG